MSSSIGGTGFSHSPNVPTNLKPPPELVNDWQKEIKYIMQLFNEGQDSLATQKLASLIPMIKNYITNPNPITDPLQGVVDKLTAAMEGTGTPGSQILDLKEATWGLYSEYPSTIKPSNTDLQDWENEVKQIIQLLSKGQNSAAEQELASLIAKIKNFVSGDAAPGTNPLQAVISYLTEAMLGEGRAGSEIHHLEEAISVLQGCQRRG